MAGSSRRRCGRGGGGFTITEILVVIGVIVVLMGILLPAISSARKSARRTRIASDLNAISVALEAYRLDHGDYPRLAPGGYGGSETPPPGQAPNVFGAQLLTWALIAPAGDIPTGASTSDPDGNADGDGADGPGFRLRRGISGTAAAGKVYGPYLETGKFRLSTKQDGTPLDNPNEAMILDSSDGPVYYYPAHPRPAQARPKVPQGYVWNYVGLQTATTVVPIFNSTHNDETPNTGVTLAQLQARLGAEANGALAAGKQAVTAPYILWSPGGDAKFGGPAEATGADDVIHPPQ